MLAFEPYGGTMEDWERTLTAFSDHQIFQTPAWLAFVSETQAAEPVLAALKDGQETVGYFAGLIVRKWGLRILGSPLPGWTTSYMGIRLREGVPKSAAFEALVRYAFRDLRCVHLEMRDRSFGVEDAAGLGFKSEMSGGFEVDLRPTEEEIFNNMAKDCRRSIRKAKKNGVIVGEAYDEQFVDDYYAQLEDVFARQLLLPTYDKRRVCLLIKHLMPTGRLLLLRARSPGGRCIATHISQGMNVAMYGWGAASYRKDRHLRPNELIQWHAMRYWKERGMQFYDMVGGGEYKRKYGGREFRVARLWKAKYRGLARVRGMAKQLFKIRQRLLGRGHRAAASHIDTGTLPS